MAERLDADRLEVLRLWGEGLGRDPREEVRAAGRAIVLLVAEVEQLHIQVWHERTESAVAPEEEASMWTTLVGRLRRRESTAEADVSTAHPQAEENPR